MKKLVHYASIQSSVRHMKYFFLLISLTHCATRYESVSPSGASEVTARISARLPITGMCGAMTQIASAVTTDTRDEPCELSTSFDSDGVRAVGECQIPTVSPTTIILQYFVTSTAGAKVVIGESVGRADVQNANTELIEIFFDSNVSSLKPKSMALASETIAERDRFNCDRTGDNTCASGAEPSTSPEDDADTCSNLQELCAGTLFLNSNDQCTQN